MRHRLQFLVDRFGRLFEGRFGGDYRNVVGAQAAGFNTQTFGVSSHRQPRPRHLAAPRAVVRRARPIGKLIGWKAWLNGLDPSTSVTLHLRRQHPWTEGHRRHQDPGLRPPRLEPDTCPGDLMFSKLATMRSTRRPPTRPGVAAAPAEVGRRQVEETYARPSRHLVLARPVAASATGAG